MLCSFAPAVGRQDANCIMSARAVAASAVKSRFMASLKSIILVRDSQPIDCEDVELCLLCCYKRSALTIARILLRRNPLLQSHYLIARGQSYGLKSGRLSKWLRAAMKSSGVKVTIGNCILGGAAAYADSSTG